VAPWAGSYDRTMMLKTYRRNVHVEPGQVQIDQFAGRRWWQMKRTWLIGLPVLIIIGIIGLFAWGQSQPRPEGFEPIDEPQVVAPVVAAASVEESTPEPIQIIRYTLDAKSSREWVLFNFNEGSVVDGDLSTLGWDLAFRRTKLLTNSGVTNPSGPGGAIDLGEVPLDEATLSSSNVVAVDVLGGEDEDEPENAAIGRWYKYSFMTHIVSTKPNTYLVRTGGDLDALVQFDSYYCADEESGCITFRYRLIPVTESD
jgi:hypothetical protein